ncbi:MAG TPA: nodulation protein NfeD [Terriglobia bacterium]|nr:nodulation protein NfeD [Terriglobia bacterium]
MTAGWLRSQFVVATIVSLGAVGAARATDASRPVVLEINLDGIIQPISAEYVERGIAEANRIHANAVLLELSTPGGLGTSMRDIIRAIVNSRVPVITYVYPSGSRAASAGFFILLSGDIAVMAPGTNAGAAHPVLMSGADVGKTEAAKVENDAAAYIRTIAQQRGRNAVLAEAGVRQSKSYTDQEALHDNLIDAIAATPHEIFREYDDKTIKRFNGSATTLHLGNARIEDYAMSSRERFLSQLADPNIAFVLGAIGAILLYFEFTHPGMVLPGVAGAILILLALLGFQLLPINYVGVILLVVALVLFALEAHVTSHGLLAAGGIAAMLFGSLILIKSPWPGAHIHLGVSLSVTLPLAVITVVLLRAAILAKRQKAVTGAEGLLYAVGVARTDLAPIGKILVHGEIWDARANDNVLAGKPVRVCAVEGLTLVVEPVTQSDK